MGRILEIADRISGIGVQAAMRVAQWPAVMRERNPTFHVDETLVPSSGGVHAIIVKYARHGLSEDFCDLLDTLRDQGVNAVVVCNGTLRPDAMQTLRAKAHRILVRSNVGRDMGAYRAATLHLLATGLRPQRMLYLNDSVVYLRGPGLDSMIATLVGSTADMHGTFENHEIVHHLGSYAFSVSGEVFAHPEIVDFWRRYRPYDIRPHAIRKGELAYSDLVRRLGYGQDVIYSIDKLSRRLDEMSWPELVAQLRHAPIGPLRDYRLRDLMAAAEETRGELLARPRRQAAQGDITPTIGTFRAQRGHDDIPPAEREARQKLADRIRREVTVNLLVRSIHNGSQVHKGFGLFHRVMDAPLVKKDLLMRGFFDEQDCDRILDRLPLERRDAVMRELLWRGRLLALPFWRRFRLRHGLE